MWERIFGWIARFLLKNGVTLLLFALLVTVMTVSLDEANWVKEDRVFIPAFNLGLLFGWLLARSRFPGWFAALYAMIIATFAALNTVGHILPSIFALLTTPLGETVNQMNLRAFELYLRGLGWLETLRAGENIQDTGLFVLLLSFILCLSGVWLVWFFNRRRNAFFALLPIGLLFAVNIHLSRQSQLHYAVFLFCAMLLIARSYFTQQHEDWQRRQVDFPDGLGMEWSAVAVVLALIIVMTARTAPLFGTQEGWQVISEWVNRYREQTSETAEKLFGGVNQPPPPAGGEPDVYVNTPNMDEIGRPVPQGVETIMWVSTSDPPPLPAEVGMHVPFVITRIHYWRNGIYGLYTGRGWDSVPMKEEIIAQPEVLPEEAPPGRYYLRQTFEIRAKHSGALFSVNDPVQAGERASLRGTVPDNSVVLEGEVDRYEVVSLATRVTANQLATAPVDYAQDIRSTYLQLPENLPERVRALSRRVAGDAADPYHKALNIQNYLRANFPYDLGALPTPERRDLVDYFLFDLQKGFCSHYASAMAVMLRAVDVPARVVTGYAMGNWDTSRKAYRVPVAASHAWVEVYFPGYGWVEFEPTAYRSPIEYAEDGSSAAPTAPLAPGAENTKPVAQPYIVALIAAGGLFLLALPFLLLRMFASSSEAPSIQVDVLYRRMRRALDWAGLAAVSSMTPDEYLLQYSERLEPYTKLNQALRQATALYRETIYSPHAPDETRVRSASRLWQNSLKEWLLLWGRAAWERMRWQ